MGPSMYGMGDMMSSLVRAAFKDAVQTALMIAAFVAIAVALVVSLAFSARLSRPIARLSRPIARLAAASRRIADGRYVERVPVTGEDELGKRATSFNTMTASLEATERRKIELVGDMAHEFRTPLTTLDGYLRGSGGQGRRADRSDMDPAPARDPTTRPARARPPGAMACRGSAACR